MGDFINIFEMSPRDGLQNEKKFIATKDKIKFINNYLIVALKKLKPLALSALNGSPNYLMHLRCLIKSQEQKT